jgi:general nucleoside transport system ATP-binding protein
VNGVIRAGVELLGIHRRFGDLVALSNIDFSVRPGEIHALLGENGAGKSTLIKIMGGLLPADSGVIRLDGDPLTLRSPLDAAAVGIGMVHQHFMLVPSLTVAEHLALADRSRRRLPRSHLRRLAAELRELGERHGLGVDPTERVRDLSVGEQQRVEILRALHAGSRYLVLDEPTANLAPSEVHGLLERLRDLADDHGTGIVIITHHLDEAISCADRISVLRQGHKVAETTPGASDVQELARLMVGRDVHLGARSRSATPAGDPRLVVDGVRVVVDGRTHLEEVTLEVRPGEILGVAGVEGNGQRPLEEVLTGLRAPTAGRVLIDGVDHTGAAPTELFDAGVGAVASDRYERGLIRAVDIGRNLVLDRAHRPPFRARFGIRHEAVAANGRDVIERLAIKADGPHVAAGSLSGGHAQRVVLGRALRADLRVFVVAQPTRGLDVGAMEFVWGELERLRDHGVAVLVISNDLDEVLAVADRCVVLYRGRVTGRFERPLDATAIGRAMGGLVDDAATAPTGAVA